MPALRHGILWLPETLQDIRRLYDFLAENSSPAAADAVLCIQAAAQRLAGFPESGAPMPDGSGRREMFAAFGAGAYVLRYRLNPKGIPVVIRVWHSREARPMRKSKGQWDP